METDPCPAHPSARAGPAQTGEGRGHACCLVRLSLQPAAGKVLLPERCKRRCWSLRGTHRGQAKPALLWGSVNFRGQSSVPVPLQFLPPEIPADGKGLVRVVGLRCSKKPNAGKTLTFSVKGRFVCSAARAEPGKQQEPNKGLRGGKRALTGTNSHLLTAARGCRQRQECHLNELCTSRCAIYPLSGGTETHARGSALAGFPR